jgi:hypothetical protein
MMIKADLTQSNYIMLKQLPLVSRFLILGSFLSSAVIAEQQSGEIGSSPWWA